MGWEGTGLGHALSELYSAYTYAPWPTFEKRGVQDRHWLPEVQDDPEEIDDTHKHAKGKGRREPEVLGYLPYKKGSWRREQRREGERRETK